MDNLALETHIAQCIDSRRRPVSSPAELAASFTDAPWQSSRDRQHFHLPSARYSNEAQPLWALPVLDEKTEIARTCSHRMMMTRKAENSTIYSCPRCCFWLDSSLANLEDALLLWIDYVESWERFWKDRKKNKEARACLP